MIGKRTKNSFSFDSVDNNFPYKIQESGVAKKTAIFNYSSEYFRKKKAGSSGSYLVAGGNIPWNMEARSQFTPVDLSNGNNPPPPITCTLNRGSAHPLTRITPFNLSPNKIAREPCPCKRNPQYDALVQAGLCQEGAPCYQETRNEDGSVQKTPVLSELYVDCTDSTVIPEKGLDQKPNFLYMPTYQTSCSTHPRAQGYAHEDNYDCLKESKFGAGDKDGVCCDTFCFCATSSFMAFEKVEYPNPNFTGSPGETIYDSEGNIIPENFIGFESLCATAGFCCNQTYMNNIAPGYETANPTFKDICTNECNFGYYLNTTNRKYHLKVCPSLDTNYEGEKDPEYEFPESAQTLITNFTNQTGIEVKPEDFYPYTSDFAIVFLADGNKNCGCGGEGGIVNITGTRECKRCVYVLPQSMDPSSGYDGPIITIDVIKCQDTLESNTENTDTDSPSGKSICGCIFNQEVNFGDAGTIYITTLTFPSNMFPNGSIIELDDKGAIRARGCGDEFNYNCNDIS